MLRKKIVFVIPTLSQGGAERVVAELAEFFAVRETDVMVVLLAGAEQFYSLPDSVEIIRLDFENRSFFGKVWSEIRTFFRLRSVLRCERPDAVVSFMTKYNVFTILAASFLSLRVFVSDRSSPSKRLPWHIAFLRRLLYRFATGIVAQTERAKEILSWQTGSGNITVVPNPVRSVALFPDVRREKIIISVGRMVPEKGHTHLLKVFSMLDASDWRLVILGDGPLRETVVRQAEARGIRDRFELPGRVKNVDEWLARASIFAFSSVSEGFPNALIEAMAAGLPCVSFDCDAGPSDIIEDGKNGYLVPVEDVSAMRDRIAALIEDRETRKNIGGAAQSVRETLDAKKICALWANLFTM